jgi:hypothetical protein
MLKYGMNDLRAFLMAMRAGFRITDFPRWMCRPFRAALAFRRKGLIA